MAKPRNKTLDYLTYLGVRLFAMFVHMFDWHANYRTARWLGDLMFRFDRRHRTIATAHLRLSFPGWPEAKVRKVARASMRSMVYLALEMLFAPRILTPLRWREHIRLANQQENLRLLTRRETGIVYIAGHFGNWEIVGYTMAVLGFPGYAVARPLDNPYLNEYLMGVRERAGLTILDKTGASAMMDDILQNQRYVAFIADQDAGRKGLFVDFFGRKASTFKAPALMAIRYEVPVVVGYGLRLGEGFQFEIGIERMIYPNEWADKDDPLRWLTQEYTAALESTARRTPEQYLWAHRRWKHRPKGESPAVGGVA